MQDKPFLPSYKTSLGAQPFMLKGVFLESSLPWLKSTYFHVAQQDLFWKQCTKQLAKWLIVTAHFFFFLQSWITQSLFQPRRTLCSVVAMVPMDMCTWNSWVTLEPLLGSWSHQEENYIAMKTRVASKLSLLLVLILLLLPLLRSCCWSRGHDCENCELQCKYQ